VIGMNQQVINKYKSAIVQAQRLHSEHQRRANRVYVNYGIVIPPSTYPGKIERLSARLSSLQGNAN